MSGYRASCLATWRGVAENYASQNYCWIISVSTTDTAFNLNFKVFFPFQDNLLLIFNRAGKSAEVPLVWEKVEHYSMWISEIIYLGPISFPNISS